MRNSLFALLFLPVAASAATMDYSTFLSANTAADNIIISTGIYTDPADPIHTEPVLFVKFTANYGLWGIWHTCAITWVKEFMAVSGDRTLKQAVTAPTAHGYKVEWNDSYKPAPANINPWCLQ
jgi:hypothetical protein